MSLIHPLFDHGIAEVVSSFDNKYNKNNNNEYNGNNNNIYYINDNS